MQDRYLHDPFGQAMVSDHYEPAPGSLPSDVTITATYWALTDNQGTVTDILDSQGHHAWHGVYDSYGNLVSQTTSSNPPAPGSVTTGLSVGIAGHASGSSGVPGITYSWGYTGESRDSHTGLNYHRTRWYAPTTGRFISEDPLGWPGDDQGNLYRYVSNGPMMYVDPSGWCKINMQGPSGDMLAVNYDLLAGVPGMDFDPSRNIQYGLSSGDSLTVSQALNILGLGGNTTTASYAGMSQWASNLAASVPGGGGFQNYAIDSGVNLSLIYNLGQTASASGGFMNNLYDSVDWLGRQAQALDQRYAISTRMGGLGMMAGGGLEIGGGVAIATGGTAGTGGLAAPAAIGGGFLIAAHGADLAGAGWQQFWSGQTMSTHTTQLLQSSGMSPAWAQTGDAVISIVGMNVSNVTKMMPTRVSGTAQVVQAPKGGVKLPGDASKALTEIEQGAARPNVRNPKPFVNDGRGGTPRLPEGVNYTEHTVNPRPPGGALDGKRIVTGSDGSVWYTDDHFTTWTKVK